MHEQSRRHTNRETGTRYEQVAARFLEDKGYRIIALNERTRYGEIDIIARDTRKQTLVFAEVKFRSSGDIADALAAVDHRKQQQVMRMARHYMMKHRVGDETWMRFDVIGIDGTGEIIHIENAFDAGM